MKRRAAVVPVRGRTRVGQGARGRSKRCKGEQRDRSLLIMIVIVRMMKTSRMRAVIKPRRKGKMRWKKVRMRTMMMRVRRAILTVGLTRMN